MPMAGLAFADHRCFQNVQRSKQRGCAVALLIMCFLRRKRDQLLRKGDIGRHSNLPRGRFSGTCQVREFAQEKKGSVGQTANWAAGQEFDLILAQPIC
jgi:hypothetical protein